jgi:hypothetical protein
MMRINTLDELKEADDRSLVFSPWGLGGRMRPKAAAEFQQRAISSAELVPAVPGGTRQSFERLRSLHSYGILCYDFFTVADELTLLVLEQALGERFVAYYGSLIPVEDKEGRQDTLTASSFENVYAALNRGGSHARGGWRLKLRSSQEPMDFRGGFSQLVSWARKERLLRGQRNRLLELVLVKMRNRVAHPSSFSLISPVESARSIKDAAEIINHLWGYATAGGRLYPAPLGREVLAIGWDRAGTSGSILTLDQLLAGQTEADHTYILVRAVPRDESLWWFDAQYETTTFPSELLWGPGRRDAAIAWADQNNAQPDEADYLDRWFLVASHHGEVALPRRPEIAAGLSERARDVHWYLVKADFPGDARAHVLGVLAGESACSSAGPCDRCAAEVVGSGSWQEIMDVLQANGVTVSAVNAADVRVPIYWRT